MFLLETAKEKMQRSAQEKMMGKWGKDWRVMLINQGIPRIVASHPKLGERHGTDSPSETPEGTNLDSSLQNCEIINVCSFKPLSLW